MFSVFLIHIAYVICLPPLILDQSPWRSPVYHMILVANMICNSSRAEKTRAAGICNKSARPLSVDRRTLGTSEALTLGSVCCLFHSLWLLKSLESLCCYFCVGCLISSFLLILNQNKQNKPKGCRCCRFLGDTDFNH